MKQANTYSQMKPAEVFALIAAFLTLGFILTIAIAWISAVCWNGKETQPWVLDTTRKCRWVRQRSTVGERILVDPMHEDVYFLGDILKKPRVVSEMPDLAIDDDRGIVSRDLPAWTQGSQLHGRAYTLWPNIEYWREERYGWPYHCLSQVWKLDKVTGALTLDGGIDLRKTRLAIHDANGSETGFALRPIWGPLTTNLGAVYAMQILVYLVGRTIRRHILRSQNRCIRCGYSREGITGVCPECGNCAQARDPAPS